MNLREGYRSNTRRKIVLGSNMGSLLRDNARYGTVEQKIHKVAGKINGVAYLFMNWAQANIELDHIDRPTIIYVLPPSGELYYKWSQVRDYPEAQIAFVAPTDFDFEGDENDDIIEHMKRICVHFIVELNSSGLFSPIEGSVPYRVLYDTFDQNVTGIVISLLLQEERGITICNEEKREEDIKTIQGEI